MSLQILHPHPMKKSLVSLQILHPHPMKKSLMSLQILHPHPMQYMKKTLTSLQILHLHLHPLLLLPFNSATADGHARRSSSPTDATAGHQGSRFSSITDVAASAEKSAEGPRGANAPAAPTKTTCNHACHTDLCVVATALKLQYVWSSARTSAASGRCRILCRVRCRLPTCSGPKHQHMFTPCHLTVAHTSIKMATAVWTWMKMLVDDLANAAGYAGIECHTILHALFTIVILFCLSFPLHRNSCSESVKCVTQRCHSTTIVRV